MKIMPLTNIFLSVGIWRLGRCDTDARPQVATDWHPGTLYLSREITSSHKIYRTIRLQDSFLYKIHLQRWVRMHSMDRLFRVEFSTLLHFYTHSLTSLCWDHYIRLYWLLQCAVISVWFQLQTHKSHDKTQHGNFRGNPIFQSTCLLLLAYCVLYLVIINTVVLNLPCVWILF